jgi:solute carrier family 8 (sodium/calcium exchanger)
MCYIEIVPDNEEVDEQQEAEFKMLNFLLDQQEASWSGQFKKALILGPSLDSEEGDIDEIDGEEAFFHFWAMGWKLIFATIPPPKYCNGWAAFTGALIWIGIVTLIVGEFANLIGCCFMIPQSVTAITIVALGTSLPDTFASVTAARQSKNADSAVGNITGSNSVNVFLGLGLPWTVACIYYQATEGNDYKVPSKTLGFSVLLFVICSIFCFILLFLRRQCIGGELGGPFASKLMSAIFLFTLWTGYIIIAALQAFNVFEAPSFGPST